MPLINTSLPNLIQGVSQQPDAVRYDGQCEEQENAMSSVVDGLQKRPAAEFIFDVEKGTSHLIDTDVSKDAFFYVYKRTDDERYCFTQDADVLRIHNADTGEQCTVTDASGTNEFTITNNNVATSGTYLASVTPQQNFKPLTIGDSTFLLNTAIATNNSTATISDDLSNDSLVFIKQGDFSKRYGVKINNTTTTIFSRPSDPAQNPEAVQGENFSTATKSHMADSISILSALKQTLTGSATGTTFTRNGIDFTTHLQGNLLRLSTPSSSAYTIAGIDGLSGEGIGVVHREVSSLADLPTTAPQNYKVKVIGDAELNQDDFYCQFKLADNDSASTGIIGEGSWIECAGGLIPTDIDASKMPRIFVSTAPNVFEIRRMSFDSLSAGDLDSNPYPSFLGNSINNLFQYKNRLGFLSLDSIIMSEAGFGGYDSTNNIQSYNFFRTSVTDLLDADPIDVSVSSNDVTKLRSAQPFQENLILFSDNSQFVLKGGELLTPKSVSVTAITNFDSVNTVDPIPLGSYLYFPFQRGKFSGVREFTVNATSDVYDSNEITAHVPQYIPNELLSLTGSNSEQLIAMTSGVSSATTETTEDTSIVFSNYSTSRFVTGTDLLLHFTAYDANSVEYLNDPSASIFDTNDGNTIAKINDVSGNEYDLRGVLGRVSYSTMNFYRDSVLSTAGTHSFQRVNNEVHTRYDADTVLGLPANTTVNSYRPNVSLSGTVRGDNIGGEWLEFSHYYNSSKWADYTSKWDTEEGYTIEYFGALDLYNNTFTSGAEGVHLWSFSTENARRIQNVNRNANTGVDFRLWTNLVDFSVSGAQKRFAVGYNHYVSAMGSNQQNPNIYTNFQGTIVQRNAFMMRRDPPHGQGTLSTTDDYDLTHVVLTGNTGDRKLYVNNSLSVHETSTNQSFATLYSERNNIKEVKITTNSVLRPIYFRIYKGILSDAQRNFNYNNRFASA